MVHDVIVKILMNKVNLFPIDRQIEIRGRNIPVTEYLRQRPEHQGEKLGKRAIIKKSTDGHP